MPLYRVLRPITGHKKGSLTRLKRQSKKSIQALLDVAAISEVAPPPLAILPGWKEPAEKLEEIGVKTVIDFLDAHEDPVSRVLKVSPKVVKKKKESVERWLIPAKDEPDEEGKNK